MFLFKKNKGKSNEPVKQSPTKNNNNSTRSFRFQNLGAKLVGKKKKEQSKREQKSSTGKKPRINYDEKMMKQYNLTKENLKTLKKEAKEQKENWLKHKKLQVLDIFGSKSKYVSKSAKSDLMHPSKRSVTTVIDAGGREIAVEFGKRLEILLEVLRPNNKFVVIRSQVHIEKSANVMANKFKTRHKIKGSTPGINKMNADKMRASENPGATSNANSSVLNSQRSDSENSDKNKDDTNTTEPEPKVFNKEWYSKSTSRKLVKAGAGKKGLGQTFWMQDEEESNVEAGELEDEEDKKYTVTSDVVLEVLSNKRDVKSSDIPQAKEEDYLNDIADIVQSCKPLTKEITFENTLKGTIDFDGKSTKSQRGGDETANEVKWNDQTEVFIFKGQTMRRQLKKGQCTRKTEPLENIVRVEENE